MPLIFPTFLLCCLLTLTLLSNHRFLLATKLSFFSAVSRSWRISLPPLVEYFVMYLGEISSFSGSIKRSEASMSTFAWTQFSKIIHHCSHDPFFPTSSIQLSVLPDPPVTVFHLKKQTHFLSPRCAKPPLVLVPSRTTAHQKFTRTICAEGHKCRATFFAPSFFQDSSKIHVRIVWDQQRFQLFTFHYSTFFQVLLRLCNDCSVSRTPHLVFHLEVPLLLFK